MTDTTIHSNVQIDFNPSAPEPKKHKRTLKKVDSKDLQQFIEDKNNIKENQLKIVPLGWLEQVWENMMFMEYKNDIIIIDAWMLMPWGELYWVDYIIPDISVLKQKKSKIRWIVITHWHLDHIWALKHVLPELGYPTVYGTPLAIGFIKKLLEWTPALKEAKFQVVNPDTDIVKLWCFSVEFFRVNHSIPEPVWLAVHTPKGLIVHTWDFKIDYTPAIDKVADLAKMARIWQEWVKLLFSDSTNATKPWRSPSEKQIWDSLEKVIKDSKSRLVIATFSSLIWRIVQIIEYAVKYNKIVFLSGKSLINNVEIAKQLWYLKVPQWIVRKISDDVDSLPDDRVLIITTWSQWEEFSALVRIAKWEHQQITIRPWDKILLSAVPIPWNETAVINMINELIRKWADVVTNKDLDIHVSWHANQDDLKMMLSLMNPEYFVPVHWELYMRDAHKKIAKELWMKDEKVFLVDDGQVIEVDEKAVRISPKKIKLDTVMIDGLWIWNLAWEYVMKARKIMAEDGMITFILKIDSKTKELVWNIQIESRWFVYSTEVKKIHTNIVEFVKKKYYSLSKDRIEIKEILKIIKEELGDFLTKAVWRVPMIVPMFVYINRDTAWNIKDELPEEDAILGTSVVEEKDWSISLNP